jgi:hypothetical protein
MGPSFSGGFFTRILVVSDRPDQELEVNQLLEAKLNRLEAPFAITAAVAIEDYSGPGLLPDPMGNA